MEWVFAGGDAASGPSSVVEAIAAGEKAAAGMDSVPDGRGPRAWRDEQGGGHVLRPGRGPRDGGAAPGLKLHPRARSAKGFAEVETTWARAVALAETKRCLRCDYREAVPAAQP